MAQLPSTQAENMSTAANTENNTNNSPQTANHDVGTDVTTESKQAQFETVLNIPSKMQALELTSYNTDVTKAVSFNSIEVPSIAEDEILVKVSYAAFNAGDYRIAKGVASKMKTFAFPHILGSDFSGIIVKIGEKVGLNTDKKNAITNNYDFAVGNKVVGTLSWKPGQMGCLSEYVVCKPDNIIIIPDKLLTDTKNSDSNSKVMMDAAGVGIAGITSYKALIEIGGINSIKNCKILILGGSSACGLFGIQIAKAFNSSVVNVTSSKVQLCESLGATKVFNYKKSEININQSKNDGKQSDESKDKAENESKSGGMYSDDLPWYTAMKNGNFDIIYDCVATGGLHWKLCKENKILNQKNGKFISLCGDLEEKMGVLGYDVMMSMAFKMMGRKFWSMFGSPDYYVVDYTGTQKDLALLYDLICEKDIKLVMDEESPMIFNEKNAKYMFDKLQQQKAHGKLILSMVNDSNNSDDSAVKGANDTANETETDTNDKKQIVDEAESKANDN